MLFNFKYFKEVYFAIGFLFLVVLLASFGYMTIEGYSFDEAFYFTIITISTVGFGEVFGPLSSAGRIFTSFLVITTFGTFAFTVTSITKYLVTGEYRIYFENYRVDRTIAEMRNHTIICGFGRNGKEAARTLKAHNASFIVVEQDEELIEFLRKEGNTPYVEGDATDEEKLMKAGINEAKALITSLPKDSDNLFVVLTARELNKRLNIISRASQDTSLKKLKIAGANSVIMPDKVGGAKMATLTVTPDVVEFMDHITIEGANDINLEEVSFSNVPEDIRNKTISELNARFAVGISIIGFKTPAGEYIINPSPDVEIVPGSKLFVLGTPEQIQELNIILGVEHP